MPPHASDPQLHSILADTLSGKLTWSALTGLDGESLGVFEAIDIAEEMAYRVNDGSFFDDEEDPADRCGASLTTYGYDAENQQIDTQQDGMVLLPTRLPRCRPTSPLSSRTSSDTTQHDPRTHDPHVQRRHREKIRPPSRSHASPPGAPAQAARRRSRPPHAARRRSRPPHGVHVLRRDPDAPPDPAVRPVRHGRVFHARRRVVNQDFLDNPGLGRDPPQFPGDVPPPRNRR